jgi:NADH-quinone oxidoreductase subunit M
MLTGLLIVFPFLFSLILFGLKGHPGIKVLAFGGSVIEFILSLYALFIYQTQCHCQLVLEADWLSSLGIPLRFGIDGLSMLLVLLTTFLTPLIIFSTSRYKYKKSTSFYGLIHFIEMALIGVFTSLNGLLFFIFWELALVPAYFIMALQVGNDRIRSTLKFFIFTLTGSLVMLAGLIYLYFKTPMPHSLDIRFLYGALLSHAEQGWIFWAFFAAFAVIIPVFPFPAWQPGALAESPPGAAMIVAGILPKMGMYGLIRFLLPICPLAMKDWGFVGLILAITGIVYASLMVFRQDYMKRLVVYSSVAFTGLITAGILYNTGYTLERAVVLMVLHGICITGLFIMTDIIESRSNIRKISELSNIRKAVKDITLREALVLASLVIMIVWIVLFPGFILHLIDPAIKDILQFAK